MISHYIMYIIYCITCHTGVAQLDRSCYTPISLCHLPDIICMTAHCRTCTGYNPTLAVGARSEIPRYGNWRTQRIIQHHPDGMPAIHWTWWVCSILFWNSIISLPGTNSVCCYVYRICKDFLYRPKLFVIFRLLAFNGTI